MSRAYQSQYQTWFEVANHTTVNSSGTRLDYHIIWSSMSHLRRVLLFHSPSDWMKTRTSANIILYLKKRVLEEREGNYFWQLPACSAIVLHLIGRARVDLYKVLSGDMLLTFIARPAKANKRLHSRRIEALEKLSTAIEIHNQCRKQSSHYWINPAAPSYDQF